MIKVFYCPLCVNLGLNCPYYFKGYKTIKPDSYEFNKGYCVIHEHTVLIYDNELTKMLKNRGNI